MWMAIRRPAAGPDPGAGGRCTAGGFGARCGRGPGTLQRLGGHAGRGQRSRGCVSGLGGLAWWTGTGLRFSYGDGRPPWGGAAAAGTAPVLFLSLAGPPGPARPDRVRRAESRSARVRGNRPAVGPVRDGRRRRATGSTPSEGGRLGPLIVGRGPVPGRAGLASGPGPVRARAGLAAAAGRPAARPSDQDHGAGRTVRGLRGSCSTVLRVPRWRVRCPRRAHHAGHRRCVSAFQARRPRGTLSET